MKAATSFLVIAIGIPVATYVIGRPFLNEWSRNQELSASGYAVIADAYEKSSEPVKAEVRRSITKGYLLVADTAHLYDILLPEHPEGIQTYPAPNLGDDEETVLSQVWRHITGVPTTSIGKVRMLNDI